MENLIKNKKLIRFVFKQCFKKETIPIQRFSHHFINNLNQVYNSNLYKDFLFKSVSYSIPHLKKKKKGGEDSHFYLDKLLVVADGVGSWNKLGIDPKNYAIALCNSIKEFFENNSKNEIENDPINLIIEATNNVKILGSSTCCLIMLDSNKKLIKTASVGDSLYMILRYSMENKKFHNIFKSQEQSHKFNQPFQLGTNGDDPKVAKTNTHDFEYRDIIIIASDGYIIYLFSLWDNLEDNTIIEIVNENHLDGIIETKNHSIAQKIAKLAYEKSIDENYDSPFSKKARENGYPRIIGGKQDDITVIISQILGEDDLNTKIENLSFTIDQNRLI